MNAIFYLESRRAWNLGAGVVREPRRLFAWLSSLISYPILLWVFHRRGFAPLPSFHGPIAALVGATVLIVASAALLVARRRVPVGATGADLYFLSRSHIAARTVVAWLEARSVLGIAARLTIVLLLVAPFFQRGEIARAAPGVFGAVLLVQLLKLPIFLAEPRLGRAVGVVAWCAIAYGGVAFCVAVLSLLSASPAWLSWAEQPVSAATQALLSGSLLPLFGVYACAVLAFALGCALADDFYARAFSARSGSVMPARQPRRTSRRGSYPRWPGAFPASVWAQLAAVQNRTGGRAMAVGIVLAVLTGISLSLLSRIDSNALGYAGAVLFGALVLEPTLRAFSMANDLSKPLWWMGAAPLAEKLAALLFARSFPISLFSSIALLFTMPLMRDFGRLALWMSLVWCLPFSTGAFCLLAYAVFPSALDRRGPAVLLRNICTVVGFGLALVAGSLGAATSHDPVLGLVAGITTLVATAVLSVFAASALVAARGIDIARAERS